MRNSVCVCFYFDFELCWQLAYKHFVTDELSMSMTFVPNCHRQSAAEIFFKSEGSEKNGKQFQSMRKKIVLIRYIVIH